MSAAADNTITGRLTIGGKTYAITGRLEGAGGKPRMATNAQEQETHVSFSRYNTKNGTNAKGDWIKFSAMGDDGHWYTTFDTNDGARLKKLSGCGDAVLVTFKESEYGRNIVSLDDEVGGERPPAGDGIGPAKGDTRGGGSAKPADEDDDSLPF